MADQNIDVGGRPTKYKKEHHDKFVYKLCLLGAKDAELADIFEVSEATLNVWKIKHPSFMESIRKGKEYADANVAHSLYKKATGYVCPEDKVLQHEGRHTETVRTEKHHPPDTAAAFIWLKNRRKWKDNHIVTNENVLVIKDERKKVILGRLQQFSTN